MPAILSGDGINGKNSLAAVSEPLHPIEAHTEGPAFAPGLFFWPTGKDAPCHRRRPVHSPAPHPTPITHRFSIHNGYTMEILASAPAGGAGAGVGGAPTSADAVPIRALQIVLSVPMTENRDLVVATPRRHRQAAQLRFKYRPWHRSKVAIQAQASAPCRKASRLIARVPPGPHQEVPDDHPGTLSCPLPMRGCPPISVPPSSRAPAASRQVLRPNNTDSRRTGSSPRGAGNLLNPGANGHQNHRKQNR